MNAIIEIPGLEEIKRQLDEISAKIDQMTEPQPELLSVKEAAELLGVTDQTVRVYARSGELRVANRVGKKMMFHRADLQSKRSAKSSADSA